MYGLVPQSEGFLFCSSYLSDIKDSRKNSVREEVERLDANRLLNTSPEDLIKYLVEKNRMVVPTIRREEWSLAEHETQIDVRNDRGRFIPDRSRAWFVPGQHLEIEVPVDGDYTLLYVRPSTFTATGPRAEIRNGSIFLDFKVISDSAQQRDIRNEAIQVLEEIDKYLSWIRRDLNDFDQDLEREANQAISERRKRILDNQGRVASLGIPLKARHGAPQSFTLPDLRKKLVPTLPSATSVAYEPEPTLDLQNYDHILSVVQNMTRVMERSPSAFKTMGEEDLRQHFLVQLNGQFEGGATGETFNVSGKTDILLRHKDRNVFIAECKFWKGPGRYCQTIDQLLGYTAWRDTKTAILIFNRGTSISAIRNGVLAESKRHPNYKRTVNWQHESGFRFVFHHSTDTNREFLLTVLIFDVPGPIRDEQ